MNRKGLISPFILAALAGCSSTDSAETTQSAAIDFSYTLDTVRVDSGEEFIYLNWSLISSGLSEDGKHLYNFDQVKTALQFIDLENLVLEKTLPLEVEGPNGIGARLIYEIYGATGGKIVLSDNYNVAVVDENGNKSLGFRFATNDFEGEKLPNGMRITLGEAVAKDGKTIFWLYGSEKMDRSPSGVVIFNNETKTVSIKPIEVFQELDAYRVYSSINGQPSGMNYADIHLQVKNDSLIFSNSVTNKVYFYHLSADSVTAKTFSSRFTTQVAPGKYPNRTDSELEYLDVTKAIDKEVNYGPLFFDDQNEVYWRFAKEMDRMQGDTILFKTILTAFDPDFNQLHEELLPSDFTLPRKYFAREGMIYTFLNIDDELAFVRIKPKLNEN
jgi:hypothetical protein